MFKTLSRVFPFLSTLFFLSSFSFLSSFALATKNPFLEEALEWAENSSVSTAWQILISFDALFIFCVLAWILYTYCCPQKVWRLWQKVFIFFSMPRKEEDGEAYKSMPSFLENHFKNLKSDKERSKKELFRWMNVEEAK